MISFKCLLVRGFILTPGDTISWWVQWCWLRLMCIIDMSQIIKSNLEDVCKFCRANNPLSFKSRLGKRVSNCSGGPNLSTFCFLRVLCRSTTAYQDLVAFPSVEEHCIFKKRKLASTLATITSHHFTSSLYIITSHHASPPIVKEHYNITKITDGFPGCSAPTSVQSPTWPSVYFGRTTHRYSRRDGKKRPWWCRWIGRGGLEVGDSWGPLNLTEYKDSLWNKSSVLLY